VTITSSALLGGSSSGGGIDAQGSAKVSATKVAVRGVRGFGAGARSKAAVELDTSLVASTRPVSGVNYALVAYGGTLTARDTSVLDTKGTAVVVLGTGSKLTMERALVSDVGIVNAAPALGVGLLAENGGELTVSSSVVRRAASLGVIVKGGKATLTDSVVRDTAGLDDELSGFGLVVDEKGVASLERTTFLGNALSAMIVDGVGSSITGDHVAAAHTRVDSGKKAGRGLTAQNSGTADVAHAVFVDNAQVNVAVIQAAATIATSVLEGAGQAEPGSFGHGMFSALGTLTLDSVVVRGNPGVGLLYAASTGAVRHSWIENNAVGVHVQTGSTLRPGSPDEEPADEEVIVTEDTVFVDNATRVGSGELPLPEDLVLPK
jgi:hypothetical protein